MYSITEVLFIDEILKRIVLLNYMNDNILCSVVIQYNLRWKVNILWKIKKITLIK